MKKKQKQTTTDPFTTAEKKQKRMRRFITAAVVLLVVSIACWWALPKYSSLESSDLFDEEEVKRVPVDRRNQYSGNASEKCKGGSRTDGGCL